MQRQLAHAGGHSTACSATVQAIAGEGQDNALRGMRGTSRLGYARGAGSPRSSGATTRGNPAPPEAGSPRGPADATQPATTIRTSDTGGAGPIPPPQSLSRRRGGAGAESHTAELRSRLALCEAGHNNAIQQLREFVRGNPDSPLAGNAANWIGASICSRRLPQAFRNFTRGPENSGKTRPPLRRDLWRPVMSDFSRWATSTRRDSRFQQLVKDYPALRKRGRRGKRE